MHVCGWIREQLNAVTGLPLSLRTVQPMRPFCNVMFNPWLAQVDAIYEALTLITSPWCSSPLEV